MFECKVPASKEAIETLKNIMKSVSGKHWEEISVNKRLIDKVKIDHKLSDLISKSIVHRNFSNREIYSINNDVDLSNPFFKNKDFKLATEIFKKHIDNIGWFFDKPERSSIFS